MSSSPSALPTPRQLLTLILNQISTIPAPNTAPGRADGLAAAHNSSTITRTDSFPERAGQPPPSNPLGLIDPRHRPLFTTLHVLFPSLLLPALDLLDRGLVTRMVSPGEAAEGARHPLAHHHHHHPQQQDEGPQETHEDKSDGGSQARDPAEAPPPPSVYIVRSAQKPARRPYGGGGGGDGPSTTTTTTTTTTSTASSSQRAYIVHTAAWNCTCAAFAFSAFPPLSGSSLLAPTESRAENTVPPVTVIEDDGDSAEDREEEGQGSGPWQFGGASFDGCTEAGGVPPCCKHLLACVLAERWQSGLGRYVSRWEVGREEMAGVFADV